MGGIRVSAFSVWLAEMILETDVFSAVCSCTWLCVHMCICVCMQVGEQRVKKGEIHIEGVTF